MDTMHFMRHIGEVQTSILYAINNSGYDCKNSARKLFVGSVRENLCSNSKHIKGRVFSILKKKRTNDAM